MLSHQGVSIESELLCSDDPNDEHRYQGDRHNSHNDIHRVKRNVDLAVEPVADHILLGFVFFLIIRHGGLLLLDVLANVDRNGKDNDQTADNVLQVGVDAKEVQRVVDCLQDNCANYNALNGSDTAGE